MPPASRGFLFLRSLRRYASGTSPLSRPAKLPTAPIKPSTDIPPRVPPRPPQKPKPEPRLLPRPEEAPHSVRALPKKSWYQRARVWLAGHPPLLERLLARVSPRFHGPIRTTLRALPFIPPLLVLRLHFPLTIMRVSGPSMSPFLNTNYSNDEPNSEDTVVVDRYHALETTFRWYNKTGTRRLERGMVIVFRTPHNPEKQAVKRIVGLPGDRVQPLPGYGGAEDPPKVVVPWNHLWVEGDVDDRTKSVDSNWYGPISQCLVIGQLKLVWSPWYAPKQVYWEEHSYPAQKRVEKNAIDQLDPQTEEELEHFRYGSAPQFLEAVKRDPEVAMEKAQTEQGRQALIRTYEQCGTVLKLGDPETRQLARELRLHVARLLAVETDESVAQADLKQLVDS